MSIIKAPYNFVPLNDKVVTPYWAEHISHDIPFEDGESGTIEVTLTTHSPLFIRDGKKVRDKTQLFCQTANKEFFIPGSSLKGMIRSVMEIMTFSKMKMVNDHRFAYRDFHNKHLYNVSEISKTAESGWLYRDSNGEYHIEECGVPGRIHIKELAKLNPKPQIDFYSFFTQGEPGFNFDANNDEHKSARFKYDQLESPHPRLEVALIPKKTNSKDNREKYSLEGMEKDSSGLIGNNKIGTLVLTGQPDARKKANSSKNKRASGKVYEFIFWDPKNTFDFGNSWNDEPEVIQNMKWAYLNHKKDDEQSIDWKFMKDKLNRGEKIPVFYHKSGNEITSIGLSLLYKFAYRHSVSQMINNRQKTEGINMAEAIFGYTIQEEEKLKALKGRVHIGHAFGKSGIEVDEVKNEVLASPKASYYPIYVRQSLSNNRVGKYNTYNENYATIAGWKRYPIRMGKTIIQNKPSSKVKNPDKITTAFEPIKSGATFTFSIQYHNLKKVELGALISALSFHNYDKAFHSLGMAKPLGYGKVKLSLENIEEYKGAMATFEAFMSASLDTDWNQASNIRELFTMVSEHEDSDNLLEYMNLDDQDFATAKKRREGLSTYSKMEGISVITVPSLITSNDIKDAAAKIKREQTIFEQKKDHQKQLNNYFQQHKSKLEALLSQKKQQLINALHEQRDKIKREQKIDREANERLKAKQSGPNLDSIDPKSRRAFKESLEPIIKKFINNLHYSKEELEKLKAANEGLIPKEYHKKIEEKILEIAQKANNADKKTWLKKYQKNNWMKVTAEWLGEPKARSLHQKIIDYLNN